MGVERGEMNASEEKEPEGEEEEVGGGREEEEDRELGRAESSLSSLFIISEASVSSGREGSCGKRER